ncbi:hypothetical protein AL713_17670 [Clostridium botulinum]|uniref:hypothetical protein n=1 Tax=Clostridium botulinum TaxID=1491 RepID=UPI00099DAD93|nr:hypothetical protein [Clostridium botulinum]OPD28845.1 hypothetical protein AL713_17670 [Clostridium botulinum]
MYNNKKEVTSEVPVQKQPNIKVYDFKQVINELQEILVKHEIYVGQFDQVVEQLKAKIIHDAKIQK